MPEMLGKTLELHTRALNIGQDGLIVQLSWEGLGCQPWTVETWNQNPIQPNRSLGNHWATFSQLHRVFCSELLGGRHFQPFSSHDKLTRHTILLLGALTSPNTANYLPPNSHDTPAAHKFTMLHWLKASGNTSSNTEN